MSLGLVRRALQFKLPTVILLANLAFAIGCNSSTSPPSATGTPPIETPAPTDTPNASDSPATTETPATASKTPASDPSGSSAVATKQDGEWKTLSAVMAGAAFPQQLAESISLKLTGDQYEVSVGGELDKGTCTVDTKPSPMQMTISGKEGPNEGKTFLAIFEFTNENEMRICYDMTGKAFPSSFESTQENGYYLVTYSRVVK